MQVLKTRYLPAPLSHCSPHRENSTGSHILGSAAVIFWDNTHALSRVPWNENYYG